jgi:hypothetical protein
LLLIIQVAVSMLYAAIVRQTGKVIFARSEGPSKTIARSSCLRVEYDSEQSIGRNCEFEILLIMNKKYLIALH